MMPERRYVVLESPNGKGGWLVYDNLLLALMVKDVPTSRQAHRIRLCLISAWWDGANAIKNGEVTL